MRVGLDIGSTTIKCVVLNDAEQIVYSTYERHYSHILEKGKELLHRAAQNYLPDGRAKLAISGSAGMGLADSCKVPFVQEVFATRVAANKLAPGTDCIIELGGEDAKILFLTNGTEVRMNGIKNRAVFLTKFGSVFYYNKVLFIHMDNMNRALCGAFSAGSGYASRWSLQGKYLLYRI